MPETEIVEVELRGHLTAESLQIALEPAQRRIHAEDGGRCFGMIVNALAMTDYDPAARDLFVRFNADTRPGCSASQS